MHVPDITITCPFCASRVRIPANAAGEVRTCPNCQGLFGDRYVSDTGEILARSSPDAGTSAAARARRPVPSILWVSLAFALPLLCVIGAFATTDRAKGNSTPTVHVAITNAPSVTVEPRPEPAQLLPPDPAALAAKAIRAIQEAERHARDVLEPVAAAYRNFLIEHPHSPQEYSELARLKIKDLHERIDDRDYQRAGDAAWATSDRPKARACWQRYLSAHPDGRYVSVVRQALAGLAEVPAAPAPPPEKKRAPEEKILPVKHIEEEPALTWSRPLPRLRHDNWPEVWFLLRKGPLRFTVVNRTETDIGVGLRSGAGGNDFRVPAFGQWTASVPFGDYDIFFRRYDDPKSLYRGKEFTLNDDRTIYLSPGKSDLAMAKVK